MRLGGPVGHLDDPRKWVAEIKELGYRAANVGLGVSDDQADALREAAEANDIVIAEVGAWSNPMSTDADQAKEAFDKCVAGLALADRLGACCCVNITGSLDEVWDGPHPDNFSDATFDRIVEVTRKIIDAVKPTRSVYSLECMPWMLPDSPESYLELMKAIDRPGQLGVHLDPINMTCTPRRYYESGQFVKHCIELLGPHIVSCHTKDLKMSKPLTVTIHEVPITQGGFDHRTYLRELNKLDADIPLMMEHMKADEYKPAADYLRGIAREIEVTL